MWAVTARGTRAPSFTSHCTDIQLHKTKNLNILCSAKIPLWKGTHEKWHYNHNQYFVIVFSTRWHKNPPQQSCGQMIVLFPILYCACSVSFICPAFVLSNILRSVLYRCVCVLCPACVYLLRGFSTCILTLSTSQSVFLLYSHPSLILSSPSYTCFVSPSPLLLWSHLSLCFLLRPSSSTTGTQRLTPQLMTRLTQGQSGFTWPGPRTSSSQSVIAIGSATPTWLYGTCLTWNRKLLPQQLKKQLKRRTE